jgi:ATP-dependent Clp protease ATP-binding subunit ClpA
MFERFADEARRATALASEEARRFGHDFIGTEHLLLGLLAAEGAACAVLAELEVTLDDARQKVSERVHPYGSGSVDTPPFTPLAKKVLERALREALQLDAALIRSEHLLLGLVDVPDGGGCRIVVELAGSIDQVRQTVLARLDPPRPASAQSPRTLRRWAAQGRTVFTGGRPASDELAPAPRCPACQASLEAAARYRRLTIASDSMEEDPQEPVVVTVVYCAECGVALGLA